MKKLDKEQLPKAIALGVLATGLLGYAGYGWLSGSGGAAAPAAAAPPPVPPPVEMSEGIPESVTAVIPLAPIHNPDPFRPAFSATAAAPAPPPKPAPAPKPAAKAVKVAERVPPPGLVDNFNGPALDAVPMGFRQPVGPPAGLPEPPPKAAAPPPAPKPAPAPAPKPDPPPVVVTGILEGDENVAILRWSDTQRQVVRAGDRLDGGFTVKEIRSDAVLVSHGKHQWWIRIGS